MTLPDPLAPRFPDHCGLCGADLVWIRLPDDLSPNEWAPHVAVDAFAPEARIPHAETCDANPFGPDVPHAARRVLARRAVLVGEAS